MEDIVVPKDFINEGTGRGKTEDGEDVYYVKGKKCSKASYYPHVQNLQNLRMKV